VPDTLTQVAIRDKFCYDFPMISYLRGTVIDKDIRFFILEVGGVGYKVFASDEMLKNLKNGQEHGVWTHLAVREDALDLYGFADKESLGLFAMLINISGIGPKTALGVMNVATAGTLRRAVSSGDFGYLTKVSGIGRKLAEKIIIELREKVHLLGGDSAADDHTSDETDALEALKSLGYSERDAREALKKVSKESASKDSKELGAGDKVKKALKMLGSNRHSS
jgi:Holliday junction DNA helicase RuvA